MGIFEEDQKTEVEKKYEFIKAQAINVMRGEKLKCKSAFDTLWAGVETTEQAQAILDKFETSATELFTTHRAWQDFIYDCDPTWEYLVPPFELTYNEDGTVTVGNKIITNAEEQI